MTAGPIAADPGRRNNLNTVRLVLALLVLVSHVFPVALGRADPAIGGTSIGGMAVTGFFLLSGYLVTTSWASNPNARCYLAKRAARILPAFWVCLLVSALVLAPLINLVETGGPGLSFRSALSYPLANVALFTGQTSIDGILETTPVRGTVNGSLYTLLFEAGCYLVVLAAGVLGWARSRAWWATAVGSAWIVGVLLVAVPQLDINSGSAYSLSAAASLGLAFAVGAAWHLLPVGPALRWRYAALAAFAYLASLLAPGPLGASLRPAAYLCLLYALLAVGLRSRPLMWFDRNDLSYGTYLYAFPITQLLAADGLGRARPAVALGTVTLLTLALALLSWRIVERPALRRVRSHIRPLPGGSKTAAPVMRS